MQIIIHSNNKKYNIHAHLPKKNHTQPHWNTPLRNGSIMALREEHHESHVKQLSTLQSQQHTQEFLRNNWKTHYLVNTNGCALVYYKLISISIIYKQQIQSGHSSLCGFFVWFYLCILKQKREEKHTKMYSADLKQAFRLDLKVIGVKASVTSSYHKAWELKALVICLDPDCVTETNWVSSRGGGFQPLVAFSWWHMHEQLSQQPSGDSWSTSYSIALRWDAN